MKRKKKDLIIQFLGTSNQDVTGSSVLIQYKKDKKEYGSILLEMGLCQGNNTIEKDLAANRKMLENFPRTLIENIEYVFLGHSHIDHCGNLAYLNTDNGFNGKILGDNATLEISKELIKDSVYIHQKNIEHIKQKQGKRIKPYYTEPQMYDMFEKMECCPVNTKVRLNDNLEFRLINSGHVLGGYMIELWIKLPNSSVKKIVYTSDMGSNYNNDFQAYTKVRDSISKCNILISEATYNDPNRGFTKKEAIREREQLKKDIKNDLMSGKRILFSSFSFARTQTLMKMLWEWYKDEEWFKDIPVVLDGVLLHKINGVYSKVLEGEEQKEFNQILKWKNFKFNKAYDNTIATLSQRTVGIYISTSGFLCNGRIITYLQQFLGNSKDVFYTTGYSGGEGSLASKIFNPNQKTVTIDKKVILKRCKCGSLKTFSSHIQYKELIDLFKGVNCDKILVHHSSNSDKFNFSDEVRSELKNIGKTTKVDVVTPKNNEFVF